MPRAGLSTSKMNVHVSLVTRKMENVIDIDVLLIKLTSSAHRSISILGPPEFEVNINLLTDLHVCVDNFISF